MLTNLLSPECEHIRALLRAADTEPEAKLLQVVTEHLATCPTCQAAEATVTALMDQYRRQEPRLPVHLEARLLDCMCGGPKHGEGQ